MTGGDREASIRAAHSKADWDLATTLALRVYGGEILGYLLATHRDDAFASDAFSVFSERLWKAMPTFGWACSLRTYAYVLARHAAHDVRHGKKELARVPLSSLVSELAERIRTETRSFLKDEKRDAIAALRDELPEDDRSLLILRVDRDLAWNELARVFADERGETLAEADVAREAARLRKRFQLVKEKLLEMGRARGLLG